MENQYRSFSRTFFPFSHFLADLEVASRAQLIYMKCLELPFFEIDYRYKLHLSIKQNLFSIAVKFNIFGPFFFFLLRESRDY